ncbi:hypothetical protein IMSAGC018_02211 [Lachnospiraceae bacterium]|nr:hypothetical protein IMSAGC018_02211 [Lachnospiraceae bacterium]
MIIKIKRKKIYCLLVIAAAMIASLFFYVNPTDNMDFVRYQRIMYLIKHSNFNLLSYLTSNFAESHYASSTYMFDILIFMISKLFDNTYILARVCILIDYSIVAYIIYDWKKEEKYSRIEIFYIIFLCPSLLPFIHAVSGLRTSIAACIMGLVVYNFLYKERGWGRFCVGALVSIMFHPVMLFAISIALLVKFIPNLYVFIGIFCATFFVSNIVIIFQNSGNAFLQLLARKFFTYTAETQFRSYRFCFYGVIIFCILFIVYYFTFIRDSDRGNENHPRRKMYSFLICYMGLILCNTRSYEMVMRPSHLLGVFAPVLATLLFENRVKNRGLRIVSMGIRCTVMLICYVVLFMYVYHYHEFFWRW